MGACVFVVVKLTREVRGVLEGGGLCEGETDAEERFEAGGGGDSGTVRGGVLRVVLRWGDRGAGRDADGVQGVSRAGRSIEGSRTITWGSVATIFLSEPCLGVPLNIIITFLTVGVGR